MDVNKLFLGDGATVDRNALKELTSTEKALMALELRKAHHDWDSIATILGYKSRSGPWKSVDKLLSQAKREAADIHIELELQRLDAISRTLYVRATATRKGAEADADSQDRAIDRYLRVLDRRIRLSGVTVDVAVDARQRRSRANASQGASSLPSDTYSDFAATADLADLKVLEAEFRVLDEDEYEEEPPE